MFKYTISQPSEENWIGDLWDRGVAIIGSYPAYIKRLNQTMLALEKLRPEDQLGDCTALPYQLIKPLFNAIPALTTLYRKVCLSQQPLDMSKEVSGALSAAGITASKIGPTISCGHLYGGIDKKLRKGSPVALGYNTKESIAQIKKLVKCITDIQYDPKPAGKPDRVRKVQIKNVKHVRHMVIRLAFWQMYFTYKKALDGRPATEGLLDIFKRKPTEQRDPDPNSEDVLFMIDHYDMQEIVNASKKLSDEQVQELLATKIYNIHKAPDLINIYKNYIHKFITLVNGQLIPKWSAIDKFGWTGEKNDPVDESGKIKIPALQKAIDDAGKVASTINNNQVMLKSDAYQKDKTGRSTGTMEELGFNKQNIVELVKICSDMMDEQIQDKWNYWYMTAEDHRSGWNFAVNHVIRDYYKDPDLYPGLQAGEQVFLTATVVIECLQRELNRFLVKFMKVTGTSAI